MKYIFKILFSLVFLASVFSCDETIPEVIFDGDASTNRTFLSFPAAVFNLPVAIDATGSVEITLNSSTKSSTERTFNIVLVAEESTANPLTYSLPSTVTIPADSYQGTITIMGTDNDLVEPEIKQIVFALEGLSSTDDITNEKVFVNVFEVCPVPSDYLIGNYLVEDVSATVGPDNGTENFASSVVNITAPSETSRTFDVGILPAFRGVLSVNISLVCNQIVLSDIDPNLTCDGGANSYVFTNADANNGTYSVTDDSVIIVNYTEDPQGSCGGPFNSSFRLTKQ